MAMARKKQWRLLMVVILLAGCCPAKQDDGSATIIKDVLLVENIDGYLAKNVGTSGFGGKVFCAYEPLNAQAEGKIYLWVLCEEYYLEQGALMPGSGASLPVALLVQESNGRYEISGLLVPRDGTGYGIDVRAIFPPSAWSQIMSQSKDEMERYNERAARLEEQTEMKARLYYGVSTP
jgi:hypothetical protein